MATNTAELKRKTKHTFSSAIKKFRVNALWCELDWLVVYLPPGPSDAVLSLMLVLHLSGVVLVSSPQDLAEIFVHEAARMALAIWVSMLGLVENMRYFVYVLFAGVSMRFLP
ncbi:MAG: P-loop NTPase [Spirochaetota bacterium]